MSQGRLQATVSKYRQALRAREATAEHALETAYSHVLASIQPQLDRIYRIIAEKKANGEDITPALLYEANRLAHLKLFLEHSINQFAMMSLMQVGQLQHEAVQLGQEAAQALLHASLPPRVSYSFGVPSVDAIASIVGATQAGNPLSDLFHGFGQEAAKLTSDALIRGLTLGNNPREIARDVEQALQVPRWRALTIARTEELRAYRASNIANYQANSDVVQRYRWTCDKSSRTCAACLAMDGQEFDLDVDMQNHVNCRCVPTPITKSWDDILGPLGIDTSNIPDTRPTMQSGADWFDEQDVETQRKILGDAAYELWKNDDNIHLMSFVGKSHDADWGTSIRVRSAKELMRGK